MGGFTSHDDFINNVTTNSKFYRADWNKLAGPTTAQVAGAWYAYFLGQGNPTAGVLGVVGTNLAWQGFTDRHTGAILHGGDVSGYKQILNASAFSAAVTTMPMVFMLVDLLGYYPVNTTTTTGDQALVNSKTFTATAASPSVLTLAAGWDLNTGACIRLTTTTTLPAGFSLNTDYCWNRLSATTGNIATSLANLDAATYVNASDTGTGTHTATMRLGRYGDGAGVQAFMVPSTVLGAGVPNIRLTYTDAGSIAGNLTPGTLPISLTATPVSYVEYSGTGLGKYGPFLPLAAGDKGIQSVQQFNYSVTHASGVTNVILAKPLLTLPMTTVGVAGERDLMNQVPSLPKVYDGACLAWLGYAGAATPVNSAFYGHLDFGWS